MSSCPFHRLFPFVKKKQPNSHFHETIQALTQKQTVEIGLLGQEYMQQMKMIDLSKEELLIAKALQPFIMANLDSVAAAFYEAVLEVPSLKSLIQKHSTIERLKQTLQHHLIEMFNGCIDQAYIEKRIRVAERHVYIGLEPKWYMGAFQNLQNALIEIASQHLSGRELVRASKLITKILNFEQQIVLEAYEKENIRLRMEQYEIAKAELKEKIGLISEDLAAMTEQTTASIEELMANSSEVSRIVRYSTDKSKETQNYATRGQEQVKELEKRIGAIHHSTAEMEETVLKLNQSAEQIKHVISIVQQIAQQTNLLALNSAIEAARAGEHGKGFSVVAGEVRKLSEETQISVKQISELIGETSQYTASVVSSINLVQSLVTNGLKESETTRSVFDEIVSSMYENISQINHVENEMRVFVQAIDEIGSASDKVAMSAEVLNSTAKNL